MYYNLNNTFYSNDKLLKSDSDLELEFLHLTSKKKK